MTLKKPKKPNYMSEQCNCCYYQLEKYHVFKQRWKYICWVWVNPKRKESTSSGLKWDLRFQHEKVGQQPNCKIIVMCTLTSYIWALHISMPVYFWLDITHRVIPCQIIQGCQVTLSEVSNYSTAFKNPSELMFNIYKNTWQKFYSEEMAISHLKTCYFWQKKTKNSLKFWKRFNNNECGYI